MPQVAKQAVADIQCAAGDAPQGLAQRHARRRHLEPQARLGQRVRRQCDMAQQRFERQACVAQAATDVDVVAGARAAAQQRLARRHFAKDGDADVERALRGVATDQLAVVRVGQRQQALGKCAHPGGVGTRQRQRQREGQRPCAAGREVAEVDGERLVAQAQRIHVGEEVPALDQHVAGHRELHARHGREQRAVVAHARRGAAHGAREERAYQIEFTHLKAF